MSLLSLINAYQLSIYLFIYKFCRTDMIKKLTFQFLRQWKQHDEDILTYSFSLTFTHMDKSCLWGQKTCCCIQVKASERFTEIVFTLMENKQKCRMSLSKPSAMLAKVRFCLPPILIAAMYNEILTAFRAFRRRFVLYF